MLKGGVAGIPLHSDELSRLRSFLILRNTAQTLLKGNCKRLLHRPGTLFLRASHILDRTLYLRFYSRLQLYALHKFNGAFKKLHCFIKHFFITADNNTFLLEGALQVCDRVGKKLYVRGHTCPIRRCKRINMPFLSDDWHNVKLINLITDLFRSKFPPHNILRSCFITQQ